MIFHPQTGQCILRNPNTSTLNLGPCQNTEAWSFTAGKLFLDGTDLHLVADAVGEPARVKTVNSGDPLSMWMPLSNSRMHMSTTVNGTRVCMDVTNGSDAVVLTNLCKCLSSDEGEAACDPQSQWFKMVESTRSLGRKSSKSKAYVW